MDQRVAVHELDRRARQAHVVVGDRALPAYRLGRGQRQQRAHPLARRQQRVAHASARRPGIVGARGRRQLRCEQRLDLGAARGDPAAPDRAARSIALPFVVLGAAAVSAPGRRRGAVRARRAGQQHLDLFLGARRGWPRPRRHSSMPCSNDCKLSSSDRLPPSSRSTSERRRVRMSSKRSPSSAALGGAVHRVLVRLVPGTISISPELCNMMSPSPHGRRNATARARARPVRDFRLPAVDGKHATRATTSTRAPVLVVMFICNHCPYVQAVEDRLIRLARDFGPRGAAVRRRVLERRGDLSRRRVRQARRALARASSYGFPYLHDEAQDVARAFGAVCTPDIFVYDARAPSGLPRAHRRFVEGRSQVTRRELADAIEALLGGRQARSPEQRPSMGCSIKWRSS